MAKSKKASQGSTPATGQESSKNQKNQAQHQDRGIGSSFATAVKAVMTDAQNMKGSKTGFLGVESEVIDPKQFAHSLNK